MIITGTTTITLGIGSDEVEVDFSLNSYNTAQIQTIGREDRAIEQAIRGALDDHDSDVTDDLIVTITSGVLDALGVEQ